MSINSSVAGNGTASNSSTTILLGRILLSVIFLLSGFGKLTAISGTAGYFGALGLPVPTVTAVLVGLIELLGGLAVLIGFQTRIVAWVLAIFTIATGLVAHTGWADQMQMIQFLKNLAITGGFLLLASSGAGAYSIDAKRG
ncbi:MAG: DoxX family membrane protein [Mesorhizobium sp.]|uniref:DoxX family protein n=2 Tax=Mesorhizobium TaxID=68287 RepID=UPI000F761CBD|nr:MULTISPECIES: DoxX family protein [unclassified Mesorhizobium]RUX83061.1 DoxX family membrane protein [Mesorhizobium sp. M2A.F.Ca.ET.040.01.1.1]RVC67831.1 DoxX family membrane protein [Mesorhizobium sp. M00.F.Ca.ET.038.03.1.1]RVC71752.1 DoxX family membrane protein [Mesorhizobium sp. M2A.F.Ca.ET.046.02.1.1]AZO38976.1 DoxX family protein [Mesorhizobium sp. M2A.F.Ca.ET.046.03.2.1]RWA85700.1 MAG: DoxX family membrane protein [Mesorhizobium sp.]